MRVQEMRPKVFIDGEAGTTGLRIREHLAGREDLDVVTLNEKRRDLAARRTALNEADVVVLCLPDDAAREAVALVENPNVKILDASSAHRTASNWVYGFPELIPEQRDQIRNALRVSNPGCHATGFVASIRPLVDAGLLPAVAPICVTSLSGYSGGGRELIRVYEEELKDGAGFALYGLELAHKHVPEMQRWAGLQNPPLFLPGVGRFRSGLVTSVLLNLWALPTPLRGRDLHEVLTRHYRSERYVRVMPNQARSLLRGERYLDADCLNGSNYLDLFVFANDAREQALVVARFDNLGKGASGAAVQNLNLMLGLPEETGLPA